MSSGISGNGIGVPVTERRESIFRERRVWRRTALISEKGWAGKTERRVVDLWCLKRRVRELGEGATERDSDVRSAMMGDGGESEVLVMESVSTLG